MKPCPCGSGKLFMRCCKPYLTGKAIPETAEQLMRSRYTAYSRADIDYIQSTMRGKALKDFNPPEAKAWAENIKWKHLKITNATAVS